MAINRKQAQAYLQEKGLDNSTTKIVLGVLSLKEREEDFKSEFEGKVEKAEKEFAKAKKTFEDKKIKASDAALQKVIDSVLKDLKIGLPDAPKIVGFTDISKAKEIYGQENSESVPVQNSNFERNDFNQHRNY